MIKDSIELLPTAHAFHERIKFEDKISGAELKKKMDSFLAFLVKDLKLNGCNLIGHIKGLANTQNNGHLMFSTTGFDEKVRFKGTLLGKIEDIEFTINIIIYGIEQLIVKRVFEKAYDEFFLVI